MGNLSPIALFTYNRPSHTQRTLDALAANPGAKESRLYIFSDGPKDNAHDELLEKINEVRTIIRAENRFKEVIVVEQKRNSGLSQSVINGVTQVVNEHGRIIVLEDDLVTSPFFLQFMNEALDAYAENEAVVCVSAYIYPVKEQLPSTFFLRGADCWGWATWKRGWTVFENDGKKLLDEIESKKLTEDFDFGNAYPYTQMLRDQVSGLNASWAIRWYASAYLQNKLTLYPDQTLIRNIGVDGSGTHSGISDKWEGSMIQRAPEVGTIAVEENREAREAVAQFFRQLRAIPFDRRVKEFIWKFLPGSVRRAWSGNEGKSPSGWFGNYADWENAAKDATGYDSALILEKVRQSLLKVKRGEAAFERDSVAFEKLELETNVQSWLRKIGAEHENKLRVLDFGGSLGSTYFQYKNSLGDVTITSWTVVEQEHFTATGKTDFEDGILQFEASPEAAFRSKPDVLLLFSVLPYIEAPFELLEKLLENPVEYVLVDRTPVIAQPNRITLQIVPESVYKASYPAWFFNEKTLVEAFAKKHTLLHVFGSKFAAPYLLDDGTRAEWKGFVFKRR